MLVESSLTTVKSIVNDIYKRVSIDLLELVLAASYINYNPVGNISHLRY